jgi:hypothetical protein
MVNLKNDVRLVSQIKEELCFVSQDFRKNMKEK